MRLSIYWIPATLFLLLSPLSPGTVSAKDSSKSYQAGGTIAFPLEAKQILDRHGEILSLGVNHDWILSSGLDPVIYVQAIDIIGLAVNNQEITGALIMADRFVSNTMPAAIGYMMTDPQKHPLKADTQFFVEDLTGPLVVTPLTWIALGAGELTLGDKLEVHLPYLENSPIGRITIEMLLRQSSGLPPLIPFTEPIKNQTELEKNLSTLAPTITPGTSVQKSPLNFLLLGLILEKVNGKPLSDQLHEKVETYFGGGITSTVLRTDFRCQMAPGAYHPKLGGRMAWGDEIEPVGDFLTPNAGHTGLILDTDGLSDFCKVVMTASVMGVLPDQAGPETADILAQAFSPDPTINGGDKMGLGIELGRFGDKSFGWDSPHGYSFWVLPEQFAYVLFLSNWDHPSGKHEGNIELRDKTLSLLAQSTGWNTSAVDTGESKNDPASALSN